jgi:hypothetical protein
VLRVGLECKFPTVCLHSFKDAVILPIDDIIQALRLHAVFLECKFAKAACTILKMPWLRVKCRLRV